MWLRLGVDEIINLEHVLSIKKMDSSQIEIIFSGPERKKLVQFGDRNSRDAAFEGLVDNLIKLRVGMQ
jgi:hypothetical protein